MWNKIGTIACVAVVLLSAEVARADNKAAPPTGPTKTAPPSGQSANQPAAPAKASTLPTPTPAETLDDVRNTVGFVPDFVKQMPDTLVVGFWTMMKTFEMNPSTSLDAKSKELIGLAVASQIPCEYCVYFHTMGAKANGASDQEIKEAVGMAAMTRMGSTVLNGMQIDRGQFRKDVDRIMKSDKNKTQAVR